MFERLKRFFRKVLGIEKRKTGPLSIEKHGIWTSKTFKMSKVGFKPRTAYEKRLWKENQECEE